MRRSDVGVVVAICLALGGVSAVHEGQVARRAAAIRPAAPVVHWSNEARRAIVPPGPGGIFGAENYGNKFPGEAAVYMGIVHAAIYDAAVSLDGGYQPYAIRLTATEGTSPEAAIATAAHHVLVGLQPSLGLTSAQQAILDEAYANDIAAVTDETAKRKGIAVGELVASAVLALRVNDGRDRNPQPSDLHPPPAGPGVWDHGAEPALGLRLPAIRPLGLESASQFRPNGPTPLAGEAYAADFQEVATLGRADSTTRSAEQTTQSLFWTDHDLRQWNDGMLALAAGRNLDLLQTARMLAMAHVAGGDAMIACFDAKYAYWFWRPYQAIPEAEADQNPRTNRDPAWRPLRATPHFPEYPSAHACHSAAVAEALQAFFGTDAILLSLDSRTTGTTRRYERLAEVVTDVDWARVVVGFHFRTSDRDGSVLGHKVAQHVLANRFRPLE
jgi:hypothetical protein